MIETVLEAFPKYFPEINAALGGGIFIFARVIGFIRFAPVLNRKEIPGVVKLAFALILTIILMMTVHTGPVPSGSSLILGLILNVVGGMLVGFIANCIVLAISAAGDMINMQMGLSSAMVLDPTVGTQVSILGNFFGLLAVILFIDVGGLYWLINALHRSFEIFPIYANAIPMDRLVNKEYLVTITSNVLYIGLQIASPVLLATVPSVTVDGIYIGPHEPCITELSFIIS